MKRKFIIQSSASALLAALCLVSCSKQPDGLPGVDLSCPLEFTALAEHSDKVEESRAPVLTSTLPDAYTIHASARYIATDGSKSSYDYMVDEHFNHQSGATYWTSNPTTYWPMGGNLCFLCTANDESIIPLTHISAFNWDKTDCSAGVTIEVPNMPNMQTTQSEILYAAEGNSTHAIAKNTPVNLKFKHSQALLTFNVTSDTDSLVRLDDLYFEDTYINGRLLIDNPASPDTLSAEWIFYYTFPVTVYSPDIRGKFPKVPIKTATPNNKITCHLLVPAQPSHSVNLTYRRRASLSSAWDAPVTSVLSVLHPDWKAGWQYIYNIHFGQPGTEPTVQLFVVNNVNGSWTDPLTGEVISMNPNGGRWTDPTQQDPSGYVSDIPSGNGQWDDYTNHNVNIDPIGSHEEEWDDSDSTSVVIHPIGSQDEEWSDSTSTVVVIDPIDPINEDWDDKENKNGSITPMTSEDGDWDTNSTPVTLPQMEEDGENWK